MKFLAAVSLSLLAAAPAAAKPLEVITYILPAPEDAIAFAPFLLARDDGSYAAAGLEIRFRVIMGGANVGKALGRGEGDLGGAGGDTAILLRANAVPVKGVALLGHHSFVTLMLRPGVTVDSAYAGAIDVPSLQDTPYYALKAWLKAGNANLGQVTVKAMPSEATIARIGQGQIDGMVGTVDRGVRVERTGTQLEYRPLDGVYPAMAQAILASDTVIRTRPVMVRAFVNATLQAIRAIERDPAAAADRWRALVPNSGYSRDETIRIFTLFKEHVYGDPTDLGRFHSRTMKRAVAAAKGEGLVPLSYRGADTYTNRFVINRPDAAQK